MNPKEKPILFSGPMVRAILEGRKTMTRRLMKPKLSSVINVDGSKGVLPDNMISLAPYQPGDLLWVRETHFITENENVAYKEDPACFRSYEPKWKPSIFMPRWASRITLEVTGVKVERLQEISEEDAKAEGVPNRIMTNHEPPNEFTWKRGFEFLWQSLNAKRSPWERNDWVWVYSFRRVKP